MTLLTPTPPSWSIVLCHLRIIPFFILTAPRKWSYSELWRWSPLHMGDGCGLFFLLCHLFFVNYPFSLPLHKKMCSNKTVCLYITHATTSHNTNIHTVGTTKQTRKIIFEQEDDIFDPTQPHDLACRQPRIISFFPCSPHQKTGLIRGCGDLYRFMGDGCGLAFLLSSTQIPASFHREERACLHLSPHAQPHL